MPDSTKLKTLRDLRYKLQTDQIPDGGSQEAVHRRHRWRKGAIERRERAGRAGSAHRSRGGRSRCGDAVIVQEIHTPIELLLELGLLPNTFALMEAKRIEQHRPDLARRIARGEEITVKASNGELISFKQSPAQ
jgi:hypothetical protein